MSTIFNTFKGRNAKGTVSWSSSTTGTFQMMLISSTAYAENPDDNTVATALTAVESTSTTYSRATLGTIAVSTDDTNNRAVLDAADVTYSSINTGQVDGYAVIWVPSASTSDTGRWPVCYNDSTAAFPATTNGGDLTVQHSTAGLMTLG